MPATRQATQSQPTPPPSETRASPVYASLVELPYRRKVALVAALMVAIFVTTMNQSVVSTAAQNIVADLGGFELFTWLFAGFSLSSAVAVPIVGKLSDRVGRKPVLLWALGVFLAASLAAGTAQSMFQLILYRVLQGAGFAGVLGSIWIIMAAMWAPKERAKWLGAMSAGFTLSGVLGPVFGGVISDLLSWRWIFFLNVPVGGAALVLLVLMYPRVTRPAVTRKFDAAGAIAFATFASVGLFALSAGGKTYPWTSLMMALMLSVSGAALIFFIWLEPRASDAMVPLSLFRRRIFSGAMAASLTITITFTVISVFMPLYVQGVRGDRATMAAVPLIANAVGVAIGANLGGQILSRWGYVRPMAAGGLAMASSAILMLGMLSPGASMTAVAAICVYQGLGVSFGFSSFTAPVQNAMPESQLGVVTTSLQFARVLGMAVASAALGAVLLSQLAAGSGDGSAPAEKLADPQTLISRERLEAVRGEYAADPSLGVEAFQIDLARSREDLNDALHLVFRIGAFVSFLGVPLSLFTFAGYRAASKDTV